MSIQFRAATFNVENLFSRAKVLNLKDHNKIDEIMQKITELQKLISLPTAFTTAQKSQIVSLFKDLKSYVDIRENRGKKLFDRYKTKVVANSGNDWDGELEFKREDFSLVTRENTAKVIKEVKADIACVVEAEDRLALKGFDSDLLNNRYPCEMLIDGNDLRGIDVGVLSKFPIAGIWSHIFDKSGRSATFSRDCIEYEIMLDASTPLYFICNHLKSKSPDASGNTGDSRRKMQATAIAKILERYNLGRDLVIVAGDMNDTPDSQPLKPLLTVPKLHDVLDLQYGNVFSKRWTYSYKGAFNQIDYLLVSEPLKKKFVGAGVERRGIYDLNGLTTKYSSKVAIETEFPSVTHWTNGASDHAAVWADFDLS